MYITLVISSISQYGGGAERCAINLANQLVVRGYKVSMVTFDDFTAKPFYELSSKVNLICLNQLSKLSTDQHKFCINNELLYSVEYFVRTLVKRISESTFGKSGAKLLIFFNFVLTIFCSTFVKFVSTIFCSTFVKFG